MHKGDHPGQKSCLAKHALKQVPGIAAKSMTLHDLHAWHYTCCCVPVGCQQTQFNQTPAAMPLPQENLLPTVTLSSNSGCIAPDACCGVTITCAADVPGTHELLLRCTSGVQDSYVRLRVTVVVPDIQISSSR